MQIKRNNLLNTISQKIHNSPLLRSAFHRCGYILFSCLQIIPDKQYAKLLYHNHTGLDLTISKADSLDYGFSAMNHAMVLTGVNLENGAPNRWKIENSWGDAHGDKGYYICSDTWFDDYVFQAAIEKEYLGALADYAQQEPIVLDPWDPMGTLAE